MLVRVLLLLGLGLLARSSVSACPFAAQGETGHHRDAAEQEARRLTANATKSNVVTFSSIVSTMVLQAGQAAALAGCLVAEDSPVHGLDADLRMVSHQTRGRLRIVDNCRMEVSRLEVAVPAGEETVQLAWYAAFGLEDDDVANKTLIAVSGPFNASELTGANEFRVNANVDLSTVGAILLYNQKEGALLAQALIQKLKPGPAKDLLEAQPTMFENCWTVSNTLRLRWSIVDEEFLDVGLEYVAPFSDAANTWAAFGPGSPGVQDRLMGGSDVIIAGFRELEGQEDEAFADDYYIGGYEVCTEIPANADNLTLDGVCRDSLWASDDESDNNNNNAELLYSHVKEGVALLRYRRPLNGVTPGFDHDITPGTAQHFVWARGPLDPNEGMAEVQFHGYQFGQLKDLDLLEGKWECAPLEGVELGGPISIPDGEDSFSEKFEHSTVLQGDVVEVFWTLLEDTSQIRIGARAIKGASKWMSIAVGSSMTDAWAWVASIDGDEPQLLAYRMNGLDATTVRMLEDTTSMLGTETPAITDEGGLLSFEVVADWPLPGMKEGETSAPLIWAVGPSWRSSETSPERKDEHSVRSQASTTVDFATGGAKVGKRPSNAMLVAHGAFMWIAWLILAPFVGVASRYMRDDPCLKDSGLPIWIVLHKNAAAAVMAFSLVGLILAVVAVADAGLKHIVSSHAKVGVALLAIITVQNCAGMQRPNPGDGMKRRVWEISHRVFAITMLALAVAAVITGSTRLEDFDSSTRHGVALTVAWIIAVVLLFCVYEFRKQYLAKLATEEGEKVEEEEEGAAAGEAKPVPTAGGTMEVYTIPLILGILSLVAITAVAFTGSTQLEDMMASSVTVESQSTAGESTIPPTIDETIPTAEEATSPPAVDLAATDAPVSTTTLAPVDLSGLDCDAYPLDHVGDGWCDDHAPFNTAACGWDGGDCCNTNAGLYNCKDPSSPNFGKSSPKGWEAPLTIPRNPRYSVSRAETDESWVISYNNYYEFGFTKDVVEEANNHAEFLEPEGWYIDIDGWVENPMTIDVPALISQISLEERMYRHRCVEAWSITVPWIGFPLSKLLDMVKPKPEAKIVQFVSWKDFSVSRTQATSSYTWPYTEALTITEARNELAMLTVGAFGKLLTPQQGAPIRLNVPWKYGFKSIKSIQQINFLEDNTESRQTFWSIANGREYGFYANVNPEVPHPRWSQATERHYITGFPGVRMDSTRMNGYQELVDYMYGDDLDNREIYF